jgi:hypothetical protein
VPGIRQAQVGCRADACNSRPPRADSLDTDRENAHVRKTKQRRLGRIRLDAPDTTLPEGHSAGPLFHTLAAYLTQRFQIPLSDGPAPEVPLVLS